MSIILKQTASGLVVPADAPEKPRLYERHIQYDLIQTQLPKFIDQVLKTGGALEGVVRQQSGIGRYTVLYRGYEKIETEIYC